VDKNLLGATSISLLKNTADNEDFSTVKTLISGDLITRQSTRALD
jgi:hypothetical protein